MNVQNSTFHTNQIVDTTQMSINWWMNEQNRVYLYNRILFSFEKEWNTVLCYNMSKPWKHYIK